MFSTQNRFRKQGLAQAAGIVALSILAGAAEATPVYSGLQNQGLSGDGNTLSIDVNGDSVADISFSAFTYPINDYAFNIVAANSASIHTASINKAEFTTRFDTGDTLDASAFLTSNAAGTSRLTDSFSSEVMWNTTTPDGYLGFQLSGGEYGWMFISTHADGLNSSISVRDWAYESAPGTGILAGDTGSSSPVPEPGSALMLAAGLAMAAKRRRTTR